MIWFAGLNMKMYVLSKRGNSCKKHRAFPYQMISNFNAYRSDCNVLRCLCLCRRKNKIYWEAPLYIFRSLIDSLNTHTSTRYLYSPVQPTNGVYGNLLGVHRHPKRVRCTVLFFLECALILTLLQWKGMSTYWRMSLTSHSNQTGVSPNSVILGFCQRYNDILILHGIV